MYGFIKEKHNQITVNDCKLFKIMVSFFVLKSRIFDFIFGCALRLVAMFEDLGLIDSLQLDVGV